MLKIKGDRKMKCDICGKEAKTWGHCVCLECYTTPKAKDKQLAIYKRALELACVNVNCMDCCHFNCRKEPYNEKHNCIECHALGLTQKHLSKYFLDQAKKELEEEDVKNS